MLRKLSLVFAFLAGPAFSTGLEITVAGEANGMIKIDLWEDVAPLHVEQVTKLAGDGFYDNVYFHRVIEGFMAQTGDGQYAKVGTPDMRRAGYGGSELDNIPAEFTNEHEFVRGIVGMARGPDENSANSQFFIMFAPYAPLNGKYTIIGEVTEGLEVLDMIKLGKGGNGAVLGEPDRMVEVRVTE